MPKRFAAGARVPMHSHPRAQLLFAASGFMTVRMPGWQWRLPASQALWIPAGVLHSLDMQSAVDMRTLYLDVNLQLPANECRMVEVTPLVRELIVRATELPMLYDEGGADGLLVQLLLVELGTLNSQNLALRMPVSADLMALCLAWGEQLGERLPVSLWARRVRISPRTLSRRFSAETGLTFDQWCTEYTLREAYARLTAGATVLDVALSMGYAGPAAFCRRFKQRFGITPGGLRRLNRSGADASTVMLRTAVPSNPGRPGPNPYRCGPT